MAKRQKGKRARPNENPSAQRRFQGNASQYHRKCDNAKDPRVTDDFVFFYRSWPSQWHISPMVINNVQYNCCEQYMMAEKARLMGDEKTRSMIMNCTEPMKHKKYGQMVKNFNETKWTQNKRRIVYEGNYAKFSQNIVLQQKLMSFGTRTFVEASRKDRIWGIGLDVWDTAADDPKNWMGENLLGAAITEVRNTILREQQSLYQKQSPQGTEPMEQKEQLHRDHSRTLNADNNSKAPKHKAKISKSNQQVH